MFRELAKKAKAINVQRLALSVAKANIGLITDNVIDQLDVGIAGDGAAVGRYTTDYYSRFKRRAGSRAPFGTVDLKVSGDLYKGLRTDIKGTSVITDSKVSYSKYQIDRYGNRIYENTKSNQEEVKDKNSIGIVAEYTKALGL
jgi:hypothetical protein